MCLSVHLLFFLLLSLLLSSPGFPLFSALTSVLFPFLDIQTLPRVYFFDSYTSLQTNGSDSSRCILLHVCISAWIPCLLLLYCFFSLLFSYSFLLICAHGVCMCVGACVCVCVCTSCNPTIHCFFFFFRYLVLACVVFFMSLPFVATQVY